MNFRIMSLKWDCKKQKKIAVVGRKTKSSKFSVLTMSEPASKQKKYIWEGCNKKRHKRGKDKSLIKILCGERERENCGFARKTYRK